MESNNQARAVSKGHRKSILENALKIAVGIRRTGLSHLHARLVHLIIKEYVQAVLELPEKTSKRLGKSRRGENIVVKAEVSS